MLESQATDDENNGSVLSFKSLKDFEKFVEVSDNEKTKGGELSREYIYSIHVYHIIYGLILFWKVGFTFDNDFQ